MHEERKRPYIPALRFEFLTRFYDPLVRITTREVAFKKALIAQANLQNDQTILDLACGSGTLSVGIKKDFPGSEIFAFDVDHQILDQAHRKAEKHGCKINFLRGYSDDLPFADHTFDRIFSTLFFHHLSLERKITTLRDILRVLKPDGEFHLADFGLPRNKTQFALSKVVRAIDGFESTHDNLRGRLGLLMEQNGYGIVERTGFYKTILGTIRLFKATKPT